MPRLRGIRFVTTAARAVAALKAEAAKSGTPVEHLHLPNSDHGYDIANDTAAWRDALLRTIPCFRAPLPIRRQARDTMTG